jgi:hypothetical protein
MFRHHTFDNDGIIAELVDDKFIIRDSQDVLDLMVNTGSGTCDRIIIYERNIDRRFFDLKTGFAGEILQKFSNYRFRLAIIGDFSKFKSKSLHDFILESNKGGLIHFADNLGIALKRLGTKF